MREGGEGEGGRREGEGEGGRREGEGEGGRREGKHTRQNRVLQCKFINLSNGDLVVCVGQGIWITYFVIFIFFDNSTMSV
jgi:hypothetical protein